MKSIQAPTKQDAQRLPVPRRRLRDKRYAKLRVTRGGIEFVFDQEQRNWHPVQPPRYPADNRRKRSSPSQRMRGNKRTQAFKTLLSLPAKAVGMVFKSIGRAVANAPSRVKYAAFFVLLATLVATPLVATPAILTVYWDVLGVIGLLVCGYLTAASLLTSNRNEFFGWMAIFSVVTWGMFPAALIGFAIFAGRLIGRIFGLL